MKAEVVMTGDRQEKLSQRDTFLRKVIGDHGRPQPMAALLGGRYVVSSARREPFNVPKIVNLERHGLFENLMKNMDCLLRKAEGCT